MSINAKYRRIRPEELAEFQRDPDLLASFFGVDWLDNLPEGAEDDPEFDEEQFIADWPCPVDDPLRLLDITNEWQAIHYLLTGEVTFPGQQKAEPPLANVVMGGTVLGAIDVGYGPPRFLTLQEVQEVADALRQLSPEKLHAGFDPSFYTSAGGYPKLRRTGWVEGDVEPIMETFGQLNMYFREAAKAGDAMLLWAT